MVAQQVERENGEHPIEPVASDELFEAAGDISNEADLSKNGEMRLDECMEELISAEGELATRRAPAGQEAAAADLDTSLDDLLDSFIDEDLANDALAEAEAYAPGAHGDRVETARRPAAPLSVAVPIERIAPAIDEARPLEPSLSEGPYIPTRTDAKRRRAGGFWRGLGLVLLGSVLGAALTLLGLWFRSGTLDYASRSQLEALSSNMSTMQANQELTWQRLNDLDPQFAEQDARIMSVEQELAQAQQQAQAAQVEVAALSQEVAVLREQLAATLDQTQARMGSLESQAIELDESMTALESSLPPLESAVGRFDSFFTQMRDLLIELQGRPE